MTTPTWYFHESIKNAFITYLKDLPSGDRNFLSKEERQNWVDLLRIVLSPADIGPSNHLKCSTWDNFFGDSMYWGLLFQVNYKDISNDYREGSRMSRYPVFYLEPNFNNPDASKMYVVRRGLAHSVEALSRRQIVKKVEANDRGVDDNMPLDPTLRETIAFVQEMGTQVDGGYVSNKHDGSTLYVTYMKKSHPAFLAVKDLLECIPGGFGQDLLANTLRNGDEFIAIPGTSSQLVISNDEQMAYHATAILWRHEKYNGRDDPKTLLLKTIPYLMKTGLSVLDVFVNKGYLDNVNMLDENTFGLMFENCVPNLTDWCNLCVHRELTMVYPEGASYLFGVWYPPKMAPKQEMDFGAFLPHVAIYDDLLELKISQPCALRVSSGAVIDRMIIFLEDQLNTEIAPERSYYDTAVKFSDHFYDTFKEYFMGRQKHQMDNLISWEGFCVFAHVMGIWEYVKVKLDAYYKAHKHALKMIPQILEHSRKDLYIAKVYGSFARVVDLDRITHGHSDEMIRFLRGKISDWHTNSNYSDLVGLIEARLNIESAANRSKVLKNLDQSVFNDPKGRGRFWGTLMGNNVMAKELHDFLEKDSAIDGYFRMMKLNLAEMKGDRFEDVWLEYLSFIKGVVMYYGKNMSPGSVFDVNDPVSRELIMGLRNLVIKFHMSVPEH
jgi:hypothetical protein